MSYWEGPARWINTILLLVVGFIGLDTLLRLLNAQEANAIVRFVRMVANVFLAPFQGMFANQEELLTAIIAVLAYSLLAGIALAIIRSVLASRQERAAKQTSVAEDPTRRDDTRRV